MHFEHPSWRKGRTFVPWKIACMQTGSMAGIPWYAHRDCVDLTTGAPSVAHPCLSSVGLRQGSSHNCDIPLRLLTCYILTI